LAALAKDEEMRRGMAGNSATPPKVLAALAKDRSVEVRRSVARNPAAPPEVLAVLAKDESVEVRWGVAKNSNTPLETLKKLSMEDKDGHVRRLAKKNIESCARSAKTSEPA
jgi:hypothetical protein